jgi:hypothetical protein
MRNLVKINYKRIKLDFVAIYKLILKGHVNKSVISLSLPTLWGGGEIDNFIPASLYSAYKLELADIILHIGTYCMYAL